MKIKLKPHNQSESFNSKPQFIKGKENHLAKSQRSQSIDTKREFATDITIKQLNGKYKIILPQAEPCIQLPWFLQQNSLVSKELAPYQQTIICYLIENFQAFQISKRSKKKFLNCTIRPKIVQYFSRMTTKYNLLKKTLFLASSYMDKYIDLKGNFPKNKQFQFAQACLYIAMKYEEIYPPLLKNWCVNIPEVLDAEALILKALDFKLAYTSAQHYLQLYLSKRTGQSKEQTKLYQCLLELYLNTGAIYSDHPLKIVQQILDSFRSTLFMENQTHYAKIDRKVKALILNNETIWNTILQHNLKYSRR